ncbi:hypothetical protein NMG60_11017346 [Bertholletia excelsa]
MAQNSQLPKFGNWESGENVPYTEYFDKATKHKGGRKMNPNGPDEEAELKGRTETVKTTALSSKHERKPSHEDGSGSGKVEPEARKVSDVLPTEFPLQQETLGSRATAESPHHQHGGTSAGENPRKVSRPSASSDHSPLHPRYQATVGGKVGAVSSPSWERKGSAEGHGLPPSTPGRSRLRSITRGDDTPDHSPAVPKFGDWDETDPASAESYTQIFNKVREEKQSGAGKVPDMATQTPSYNGQNQYGSIKSRGCCCFPWGRK